MYSAVSGLKQHQTKLDVTSNNLANVNTVGYKTARTSFKDQLQQTVYGGSASGPNTGGTNAAQIGLGVQLASVDAVMTAGSLQATGNPLDIAIQGEGFFRVATGAPPAAPTQIQYTRAGNFQRNDQGYLTTAEGYYVMGRTTAGGPDEYIQIPTGATAVAVGNDGMVTYIPAGGGARVTAGTLSLAKFPNENGLVRVSGNRWESNPASGTELVGLPGGNFGQTIGGTLEMSNVDLAAEFTDMIVAQRGFQANSRVISVGDEMLQDLVNLKR
ncbi:flagellar hook-basal body complex protein [Conexibacter sp. SYSU D00693]|uniref:flagellar hook-basal body complex protein n=1 Tax=Conexibacter sp. SYSU D00693 TaxID=2812560 RepID=UPI00196B2B2F|nr:flagellar hook-basal body complex protein [Conexibacter sp. SYSU D00693]